MAKGGGAHPKVWYWILAACLYLPFSRYLQSSGYKDREEFFQDLLLLAVLAGLVIVPLAIIYRLVFRRSDDDGS